MGFLRTIDRFRDKRILVIGDLILDHYIWGKVSRISPEAPVPVVDVVNESYLLGGAGNVANNISAMGGKATILSLVGKDTKAGVLAGLLEKSSIERALIEDDRPTSRKTRIIAHNQQVVRFDTENRDYISGRALRKMLDKIAELVPSHDALIISDYKKGVVTREIMRALRKYREDRKKKFIAVDPKVGHFRLYRGVSLITPNVKEASEGALLEIKDEKSLLKAGKTLLKKLATEAVLITRGEEGMSLFTEGEVEHIPTVAKKVFDVTGAGDTVIAAFTLAYASGASPKEAAIIANHAAGIVVAEVGTATVSSDKLKKSFKIK